MTIESLINIAPKMYILHDQEHIVIKINMNVSQKDTYQEGWSVFLDQKGLQGDYKGCKCVKNKTVGREQ